MRAYKFLNEKWGLAALNEKRLKLSRIFDLNDPFELTPFNLTDDDIRDAFFKTRDDVAKERGLLCFSSGWNDPVIWAHYSDKHRGLCLGFEIPELKVDAENDECGKVDYVGMPLPFPRAVFEEPEGSASYEVVRRILFTKFKHWEYEQEIRMWIPLECTGDALQFLDFGNDLQIVEVVLGARCTVQRSETKDALGPTSQNIKIIKARAAYDKFEMIQDHSWESSS